MRLCETVLTAGIEVKRIENADCCMKKDVFTVIRTFLCTFYGLFPQMLLISMEKNSS